MSAMAECLRSRQLAVVDSSAHIEGTLEQPR
jgi:hypothetical protein